MLETIFTIIFLASYLTIGALLYILKRIALANGWRTYRGNNYAESVQQIIYMWLIPLGFMIVGYIESH